MTGPRHILHTLLLLLVSAGSLAAQEAEPPVQPEEGDRLPISLGIYSGFGIHLYYGSIDLARIPAVGQGNCGIFNTGWGSGVAPGIFGEYRISPNFSLGARLLMEQSSGSLTAPAPGITGFRRPDGSLVDIENEQNFAVEMSSLSVELTGTYRILESLPLRVIGGLKASIPMTGTYDLQEEIFAPEDVYFDNGARVRSINSGDLSTQPTFGLLTGAAYPLTMGGGLELVPELTLSTTVNSFTGYGTALQASFRPGLSVRYTFARPAVQPPPPPLPPAAPVRPPPPPPPPPPAAFVADVKMYGLDSEGEPTPQVTVRVEERMRALDVALLPYIFFEEGSDRIPDRYSRKGENPVASQSVALTGYHAILDVVGDRLNQHPDESVTLVGSNAGTGVEKGNTALSKARAESVKSYLTEEWGIAPERIAVEAVELPADPSNNALPEGLAENRRVAIRGTESLLAPLSLNDTMRAIISSGFLLEPSIEAEAGVREWMVEVELNGRTIRRLKGEEPVSSAMRENFTDEERRQIAAAGEGRLSAVLTAVDSSGQRIRSERGTVPVRVERTGRNDLLLGDSAVTFGSAILFGYNSALVTPEARRTVQEIQRKLPENARLVITGYADETGEREYNRRLSLARAKAVAAEFDGVPVRVEGEGESGELFPNTLPEGRFYSRTVRIRVEVPPAP